MQKTSVAASTVDADPVPKKKTRIQQKWNNRAEWCRREYVDPKDCDKWAAEELELNIREEDEERDRADAARDEEDRLRDQKRDEEDRNREIAESLADQERDEE